MEKFGALTAAALICAVYLSVTLVVSGLNEFHFIMVGDKKFATLLIWNALPKIGLSYLTLALLYLIWLLQTKRLYTFLRFSNILSCTAVFLVIAFLAYPQGRDVYLYLHFGLMNLSGVNPFINQASSFTSQLSPFIDWGQTSTYGSISQLLFTLSATLVSIHPILAVYVYKSFCLCLHIINGYLIWRLLPQPQRTKITIAYLLNPLLLMEQVASGHVDILVSTSLIVLIGSLTRQQYLTAFVAMWGGFLAKTLPIIWMPLVSIFLIKERRWKQLAGVVILSSVLLVALWITALPDVKAWKSLLNPGVTGKYHASIHQLISAGLELFNFSSSTSWQILQKFTKFTTIGFAAFYAWIALKLFIKRDYLQPNLIVDIGWVTLTLFLFATPWLTSWYASVLLPIAALIPQAHLFGLTTLTFCLSSTSMYLLAKYNVLKSIVVIGLPILVLIVQPKLDK